MSTSNVPMAANLRDAIQAWHGGQPVHVISMGGLGEKYEQGIWEMAFSFAEAMLDNPPEGGWQSMSGDKEKWRSYVDMLEASPQVKAAQDRVEPSGAMFGVALSAAAVLVRNGYQEGIAKAPEDRHILLSHAPDLAPRKTPSLGEKW